MILDYVKHHLKFYLRPKSYVPKLGTETTGGPADSSHTFVMVCSSAFDINKPNAASAIRLGYCRAFARLGIGYRLASVLKLAEVLDETRAPFVFLSEMDYEVLNKGARQRLKKVPHFVWVSPSRRVLYDVYARYGKRPDKIRVLSHFAETRVKDSGAAFLWAPCPPSGLMTFEQWQDVGVPLVSLPLACDEERYFPEPGNNKFAGVQMAFVGGYWPNKAIQFDKFLRPYESRLTVFGHSPWPYGGYGGVLPDDDERVLYRNARLCPAISEPHAEVTGDIVERVFKVAGSGGVAITDVVAHYAEIFGADEILRPNTVDEYHDMVEAALTDDSLNAKYREAGRKAVLAKHTYVHRARKVLDLLGLPCPTTLR